MCVSVSMCLCSSLFTCCHYVNPATIIYILYFSLNTDRAMVWRFLNRDCWISGKDTARSANVRINKGSSKTEIKEEEKTKSLQQITVNRLSVESLLSPAPDWQCPICSDSVVKLKMSVFFLSH